jgi:hypothetical protein
MSIASLPIHGRFPACAFQVPLYPVTVCVVPCDDNQKRAGVISKLLPAIPLEHLMFANTPAHASVITMEADSNLGWLMFLTASPSSDVACIAHEVFHLTHRILEYVNSDFSHEPYAYLHQYLFHKVTSITHNQPEAPVAFTDTTQDMELITWLNNQDDLCLEPCELLNERIVKHLEDV